MLALDSDRYIEYIFSTLWTGAALNPINIRWTVAEMAYSIDDCETEVLIVDDVFLSMATPPRQRCLVRSTIRRAL
jgi:acyl-CoA synthetase (AMP-forming)/AMP-acid ligase II